MKKQLLSFILVLSTIGITNAQSTKFFTAFGQTYGLDYLATTPQEVKYSYTSLAVIGGGDLETEFVSQFKGVSLATYMYRLRYNLTEMSDESSLSIFATPQVGLHVSITGDDNIALPGFGTISLPIGISLDKGAGSTYNSSAEKGVSFKLGIEILYAPVIKGKNDYEGGKYKGISPSFIPTASIGYRYWNKNNVMREVQFQAGYSGKGKAKDVPYEDELSSGMHFQISFFRILNY